MTAGVASSSSLSSVTATPSSTSTSTYTSPREGDEWHYHDTYRSGDATAAGLDYSSHQFRRPFYILPSTGRITLPSCSFLPHLRLPLPQPPHWMRMDVDPSDAGANADGKTSMASMTTATAATATTATTITTTTTTKRGPRRPKTARAHPRKPASKNVQQFTDAIDSVSSLLATRRMTPATAKKIAFFRSIQHARSIVAHVPSIWVDFLSTNIKASTIGHMISYCLNYRTAAALVSERYPLAPTARIAATAAAMPFSRFVGNLELITDPDDVDYCTGWTTGVLRRGTRGGHGRHTTAAATTTGQHHHDGDDLALATSERTRTVSVRFTILGSSTRYDFFHAVGGGSAAAALSIPAAWNHRLECIVVHEMDVQRRAREEAEEAEAAAAVESTTSAEELQGADG
ncbi:MAG: hypothetical protein WC763_06360 [Candidatus Paceibacterota bacterium]